MKLINLLIIAYSIILDPTNAQECGKPKGVYPLIYGGTYVNSGQWPWTVPLFYKHNDAFFCNSNLISNRHLLTAAHCINEKQSSQMKKKDDIYAYLGRYDLTKTVNEPNSKKENINKIVIHPDWKPNEVRYDADIALLQLKNPTTFTDLIQPVCLPQLNLNVFALKGKVVGWGKSESSGKHEFKPKQVEIPSYGNEDCFFADYKFAQFGSPRTFCAGERGKTPCQGDSGGGYFVENQSKWSLAGLVSAALVQECGQNDFVLFTNVAKFTEWIGREMSKANSNNEFDAAFNAFDDDEEDVNTRVQNADCKYQVTGYETFNLRVVFFFHFNNYLFNHCGAYSSVYGCYINGLNAPDNDIDLRIVGGQHVGGRSTRDVSVMQIKNGQVTHFPYLTNVASTFPNLNGFGITFTGLKKVERQKLKNLSRLKFFLINDNAIEEIPADTFNDLKNLELIDMCRNRIKRLEPTWLTSMPRLRVFKARTNQFQAIPRDMFKNNKELEEILFDYNPISKSEVNFAELQKLKLVAILKNNCVDLEYCNDPNKPNCIRSLQQFNYLVNGYCGVFNNGSSGSSN